MTESVRNRSDILKQLTTEHPVACQLMVELVKAIDYERRTSELSNFHPEEEVVTFDLSNLDSVVGATLGNLALNDATSLAFDHSAHVLRELFSDLASKGYALLSQPLSADQKKELFAKQLEVGVEVEMKAPVETSSYAHSFTGYVVAVNVPSDGMARVEDMDGDVFDVEFSEIDSVTF